MTARECITRYANKLAVAEMAVQSGIKADTLRRTANKMVIRLSAGRRKEPTPGAIDRFLQLAA